MRAFDLLNPRAELPARLRLGIAGVPLAIAAIVLAADPSWQVAVGLTAAVSPWLLTAANLCPPWPYAGLVAVIAVAGLMSRWRITDLSLMLLVFLAGQSGLLHPRRVSAVVLCACVAVPVGWQIGSAYGHLGAWVIGMAMAWLGGVAMRGQQLAMARLEEVQEELAAKAVADERRRIAREVHDLAAHSMAVTMLHLTGARLALADGEVDEAQSALASAERLGRSSLDEIRRAVGVLSDADAGVARSPQPSVTDIVTLVDDYRRAGMDLTYAESGAVADVAPIVGLALYRLTQESLANAARHAPGAAVTLSLAWQPDAVAIEVTNALLSPPSESDGGHGLVGMRERVEQLGGEVTCGAVGTQWLVRATLPTRAPTLEPR